MSGRPGVARWLPALAFAAGCLRGGTRPVVSDGAFRLVDVGGAWWTGDLAAFAIPPGGHDAPWLGAVATAAGSGLVSAQADLARPMGALALGLAAAILARSLARTGDRAVAGLGLALLLLPPAFASAFVVRPDAALAGVLLAAAMARVLGSGRDATAVAAAWGAGLCDPAAVPAAIALHAWPDARPGSRRPGALPLLLAPLAAGAIVAGLSLALPAGARGEVVRGLAAGWDAPLAAASSTLAALRDVWIGGLLFLAPLLGPFLVRGGVVPGPAQAAWSAAALALALFAGERAFAERSAVLVPGACLLLALRVGALPDPRRAAGAPARPVLLAYALPLALLVLAEPGDRIRRRALDGESARHAQLAARLDADAGLDRRGAVAADRVGALAAHTARPVRPLGRRPADVLDAAAGPPPAVIVLGNGRRPASRAEARLVLDGRLPGGWAPRDVRRGPEGTIPDVVWARRPAPVPAPDEYAALLAEGMAARDRGDLATARAALEAAADREPDDLGLAREELGLLLAAAGDDASAEPWLVAARRDPATARARLRLADAALGEELLPRADSLLAEAWSWSPDAPALRAVRARLFAMAGLRDEALAESQAAIRAEPGRVRALVNHGTMLWASGETGGARAIWDQAVRRDPAAVRFLGDYRDAPDDAPAPPLLPLLVAPD